MNAKRLVISIISLIIIISLIPITIVNSGPIEKATYTLIGMKNENTVIEQKIALVTNSFIPEITYISPENKEDALAKQHLNEKYIFQISELVYNATTWEEYNAIAPLIDEEVARVRDINKAYSVDYDLFVQAEWDAKWEAKMEEYPVATTAWLYMKSLGWSDTVCAGIMGNLMAETGGGTLNLDWDSNGSSGYGLIQWIGSRRSAIKNRYGEFPTTEQQIQFVYDELYGENGASRQVTSSQLKAIMEADSPEECAYAFACYYERCAAQHRPIRRGYARHAYEYFVG